MVSIKKKGALAVGAGVLSVALFGAAAFAAFQPQSQPSDATAVQGPVDHATVSKSGPGQKLDQILSDLVAKGTITDAQKQAIEGAVKDAVKANPKVQALEKFVRDLGGAAAAYIGITPAEMKTQLQTGKSLAEIASDHGKDRAGLVTALTTAANADIDKAAAVGKVTADQAAMIKTKVADHVASLVDRKKSTTK
ncbi:MAG: hypothetical protein ABR525_00030 [Candidatus Limnocylindria bacterium]